MVAIHELAIDSVRGFVCQSANIVVGTGESDAVKDTVKTDESFGEATGLSIDTRNNVQPAVRRVEQPGQFLSILWAERRKRIAHDLARLINGKAGKLQTCRLRCQVPKMRLFRT